MSKNFVREIDGIKNINKQEFYTNKANDLLSTKEHNYIRKETQKYHCLTDNIKTLSSDNTDLLSVTNYNKTKNTATIHPKHDAQKEQILTSPKNTLSFKRGANGSNETTKVDISEGLLNTINKLSEELATLNKKQPLFHTVSEFAGDQFFNMQTTQTYNFSNIDIYTRVAYRLTLPSGSITRNFDNVLKYGAKNFNFNEYDITLKNYYNICGAEIMNVAIDSAGTGLDFTPPRDTNGTNGFISGEVFIKFSLTKKATTSNAE